jgi:hypothetical protein
LRLRKGRARADESSHAENDEAGKNGQASLREHTHFRLLLTIHRWKVRQA